MDGDDREASLEVLRMALQSSTDFTAACRDTDPCRLEWRPSASKLIWLFTNEDSDLPFFE